MALVYTPSAQKNKKCPDFSLPGLDSSSYSLNDFEEKILVFMFICGHCPYVLLVEDRIIRLAQFFKNKSVRFVGICSNDSSVYPEDSFENLKKRAQKKKYNFLYLYDEDQIAAKKFEALCTPDFFIYNQDRKQVWRGRIDDSVEDSQKVKTEEMKLAIENLLIDKKPPVEEPSFGCSIKWKKQA